MTAAPEAWNLSRRIANVNAKVGWLRSDARDAFGTIEDRIWLSRSAHEADVWALHRHAIAMERRCAILEQLLIEAGVTTRERLHELTEDYPSRRRTHEAYRETDWHIDDAFEAYVRVDDIDEPWEAIS